MMRSAVLILAGLAVAAGLASAAVANMSGHWELNVAKSRWGTVPKPSNTRVVVEHNEPTWKYRGTVNYGSEHPREFTFEGAIDGKSYPQSRSYGEGTATIRRINDYAVEATWKSKDGKMTETTRTVISADGKTMTRTHQVQGPQGRQDWTEIWDRQ